MNHQDTKFTKKVERQVERLDSKSKSFAFLGALGVLVVKKGVLL